MGASAVEPLFFCSGGTMFSTARVIDVFVRCPKRFGFTGYVSTFVCTGGLMCVRPATERMEHVLCYFFDIYYFVFTS
jgi:hypothetical protein